MYSYLLALFGNVDPKLPSWCPNVAQSSLMRCSPREEWPDKAAYDAQANKLAHLFIENFKKYAEKASPSTKAGGPRIL